MALWHRKCRACAAYRCITHARKLAAALAARAIKTKHGAANAQWQINIGGGESHQINSAAIALRANQRKRARQAAARGVAAGGAIGGRRMVAAARGGRRANGSIVARSIAKARRGAPALCRRAIGSWHNSAARVAASRRAALISATRHQAGWQAQSLASGALSAWRWHHGVQQMACMNNARYGIDIGIAASAASRPAWRHLVAGCRAANVAA